MTPASSHSLLRPLVSVYALPEVHIAKRSARAHSTPSILHIRAEPTIPSLFGVVNRDTTPCVLRLRFSGIPLCPAAARTYVRTRLVAHCVFAVSSAGLPRTGSCLCGVRFSAPAHVHCRLARPLIRAKGLFLLAVCSGGGSASRELDGNATKGSPIDCGDASAVAKSSTTVGRVAEGCAETCAYARHPPRITLRIMPRRCRRAVHTTHSPRPQHCSKIVDRHSSGWGVNVLRQRKCITRSWMATPRRALPVIVAMLALLQGV
ncbi:hypothetical protein BDW22DRAFT_967479 [Trametopsis cervina]|nr:hypothetical protein BDW22DRAFT_967479 [Trametopsis cervina]